MMLNRSSFDLESVVLEDTVEKTEEPSFADTMKDFWKYKQGLLERPLLMNDSASRRGILWSCKPIFLIRNNP